MSEPAVESPSSATKVRRIRSKRPTTVVAPPPRALQAEVDRTAKIIQRHQRVLGPIGIEALRVATLQVVAQKLSEIQALLQANGLAGTAARVAQPTAGPSCALCGRPGIYQSRSARVEKGQQRPYYCQDHAPWAKQEDGQAAAAAKVMPSAPGAPNLAAAMAALE